MPVKLHFLNVGDGDCTIIDFPTRTQGENNLDSRIMVVDFKHNVDHDEYETLINYYKNNFTENGLIKPIFRFIATHPHKDHLTGIKELFENSGVEILNFWDLDHKFKPIQYGENWESYKNDWEKYCNLRNESFVRRYWDDQNEKNFILGRR